MSENPLALKIQEYLEKHRVQQTLQVVINELCKEQPADAYGYLVRRLQGKGAPPKVARLHGREVLDSRGNPTVECDCYVTVHGETKLVSSAAAPSGASTGSNEARELRDGDKSRYMGKGVLKAAGNIDSSLSPAVANADALQLVDLDERLCKADGTELKVNVGGNAITAASFALALAGAQLQDMSLWRYLANTYKPEKQTFGLPTPMVNILNGGKHAGGNLKFQEFMIMPNSALPFAERLRVVTEVYHTLGRLLGEKYGLSAKNLGDEGGFAPPLDTAEEAIDMIEKAIVAAGFTAGKDVFMALDVASSEFYSEGKYEVSPGKFMTGDELLEFYVKLVDEHPALKSIEDGFDEKDYDSWMKMTQRLGDRIMIVGDDLYTTNTNLIRQGVQHKWANALLMKVNQIGTITEAVRAGDMIFADKGQVIVSHRSGETGNSIISDLAVAIGAKYIKTGAPARGERVVKYNRLLQIEAELRELNLLEASESA